MICCIATNGAMDKAVGPNPLYNPGILSCFAIFLRPSNTPEKHEVQFNF